MHGVWKTDPDGASPLNAAEHAVCGMRFGLGLFRENKPAILEIELFAFVSN